MSRRRQTRTGRSNIFVFILVFESSVHHSDEGSVCNLVDFTSVAVIPGKERETLPDDLCSSVSSCAAPLMRCYEDHEVMDQDLAGECK